MMLEKISYFYCVIFLIPLVYLPWGSHPYSVGKNTFFLLTLAVTLAVAAGWLGYKKEWRISFSWLPFLFGSAFLLSLFLSTIFATAPLPSFFGDFDLLHGALLAALVLLHGFFCYQLFTDRQFTACFFQTTLAAGALTAVYAVAQFAQFDPLPHADAGQFMGRVFATLGGPNFLGQFLLFPIAIGAGFLFTKWRQVSRVQIGVWLVLLLLLFIALFLTHNRASLLGLGLVGWLYFFKFSAWPRINKILITIVLAAVGVTLLFVGHTDLRSVASRAALWHTAPAIFMEHPVLGGGTGIFAREAGQFVAPTIFHAETLFTQLDRVHNNLLETLLERGLLGGTLYGALLIFLAWAYRQPMPDVGTRIAFGGIIASGVSLLFSFATVVELVFLAAFWAILARAVLPTRQLVWQPAYFLRVIFMLCMAAAAVGLSMLAVGMLRSDFYLQKSMQAYLSAPQAAPAFFARASAAAPFFAMPLATAQYFLVPTLVEDSSVLAQLIVQQKSLSKLTRDDADSLALAVGLAAARGDVADFRQLAVRLLAAAPKLPSTYKVLGNAAYQLGLPREAVLYLEKLRAFAPPAFFWTAENLITKTFAEREKYRLFRKTNYTFVEAMQTLVLAYQAIGQQNSAAELQQFL